MQETSPLSPPHDYQDVDEDIPMHDVSVLSTPDILAKSVDIPQVDRNDTDIPDAILLEVHIPLPSTAVVPDLPSLATHSKTPVSHSIPDV